MQLMFDLTMTIFRLNNILLCKISLLKPGIKVIKTAIYYCIKLIFVQIVFIHIFVILKEK